MWFRCANGLHGQVNEHLGEKETATTSRMWKGNQFLMFAMGIIFGSMTIR